ncbi:MAG: hypothetical protein MJZ76_07055 [Bacteroidales bacterium]|nr:hypothetical protein [Bacteroidales bacterium]
MKKSILIVIGCCCTFFAKVNAQDIPANVIKVSGTDKLYVAQNDELGTMDRASAISICAKKGNGWHLPSVEEISLVQPNILNYGLSGVWYWTTTGSADKSLYFLEYNPVLNEVNSEKYSAKRMVRCFWSNSSQDGEETVSVQQKTNESESQTAVSEIQNTQQDVPDQQKETPKHVVVEPQDSKTVSSEESVAQYRNNSIGIVLGNMQALSLKFIRHDHFGIELDLGMCISTYTETYYAAGFNLNFMGIWNFTPHLYGFAGGGFSFGFNLRHSYIESPYYYDYYDYYYDDYYDYYHLYHLHNWGKAGVNSIVGVEYSFDIPLALSFDFRPGAAFLFDSDGCFSSPFDWALNLGVHYKF